LILKGEMPDKNSEKMLDSMLTIAIDHGVEPSSVVAARNVYSAGSPLQAAVAAGVLAFGEYHGGAIEGAMEIFKKYCPPAGGGVKTLVDDFNKSGERVLGFGHRLYSIDPRTQRLLALAKEFGFLGKYVKFALEVEKELSTDAPSTHSNNSVQASSGQVKRLPLNIDGILAALLCEMGFNPKSGKGFFIIARTPGIVAHVVEEALREKPVRRLSEADVEYDGPRPRK
ncbi:MAG: citryl-CoA lyase, partial [Candidatus Levybacteria bacterium]|nr:citryl-CoA lyase [Candidatus Levybacteria bacterium]